MQILKTKTLRLLLISVLMFSCKDSDFTLKKEKPYIEWEKKICENLDCDIYDFSYTNDDGIALLLYKSQDGSDTSKVILEKYDKEGILEWAKTLESDFRSGFFLTKDNEYIIPQGLTGYDLIKLDSKGNEIWKTDFSLGFGSIITSVAEGKNGDLILAGEKVNQEHNYTESGTLNYDFLVMKINSEGTLLWCKSFGGSDRDYPNSVLQDSDNNILLTGDTYSVDFINNQIGSGFVKLDESGNIIWKKAFNSNRINVSFRTINSVNYDGYIFIGQGMNPKDDRYLNVDFWLMKIDLDGNLIWEKKIGDTNTDEICNIMFKTSDGNYVFGGTYCYDCKYHSPLYKINDEGEIIWEFDIRDYISGYKIFAEEAKDGGIIVVGLNRDEETGRHIKIVKLNNK